MSNILFSSRAEADLAEIIDYGVSRFGADNAALYFEALKARLQRLAAHPQIGIERREFSIPLRSFSSDSHVIFYGAADNGIIIYRILHGSRDPSRHL